MGEIKNIAEAFGRDIPVSWGNDTAQRAHDTIMSIMRSRYDNLYGKKATAFAKNKAFVFDRGDYWTASVLIIEKNGYKIATTILKGMSTQSGKVYILYTDKTKFDIYTAHYFDRYAERTGLVTNKYEFAAKRKDVIKTWLGKMIVSMRNRVEYVQGKDGLTAYDYHPDGMGLGVVEDNIVLFKTFVSNDMMRKNQIKAGDRIQQFPSTLEKLAAFDLKSIPNSRPTMM